MLRITRIIKKDKLFYILSLPEITKLELKKSDQKLKNELVCKVNIYILESPRINLFKTLMSNLVQWGTEHNDNNAKVTALTALQVGFIKESAFNDFKCEIKQYKKLYNKYSQEYFNNL